PERTVPIPGRRQIIRGSQRAGAVACGFSDEARKGVDPQQAKRGREEKQQGAPELFVSPASFLLIATLEQVKHPNTIGLEHHFTPSRRKPTMFKKIVLWFIAIIVIGILVLVGVVAMQPTDFKIERKATIAAPPAEVFAQVNDFRKWDDWSPWAK